MQRFQNLFLKTPQNVYISKAKNIFEDWGQRYENWVSPILKETP